jgi:AcrR family transcriptional regulator
MATNEQTIKRMSADQRRAHILRAARAVLARDGVDRFSLEEVAREAGVAATLPRHYFESRDRLLAAAMNELTLEVVEPLVRPDPALTLAERFRIYVRQINEVRWGHSIWIRAASVDPDVGAAAGDLRRRMVSLSFGRPWEELSPAEQLRGAGWTGYFTAAVAEWIEQQSDDQEVLIDALLDGARRFGVRGA